MKWGNEFMRMGSNAPKLVVEPDLLLASLLKWVAGDLRAPTN